MVSIGESEKIGSPTYEPKLDSQDLNDYQPGMPWPK